MHQLRARLGRTRAELHDLYECLAARDARIADLGQLLSESRRSDRREAVPFSKAEPKEEPARPGRRGGRAHGGHRDHMVPEEVGRELEVPFLPAARTAAPRFSWSASPSDTRSTSLGLARCDPLCVVVGRCTNCGRRVQGRHREQASDASGAGGSQVGT